MWRILFLKIYFNVVKRFFITQTLIVLGEVIDKYGTSIFLHFHVQLFVFVVAHWVYFFVLHCSLGNKLHSFIHSTVGLYALRTLHWVCLMHFIYRFRMNFYILKGEHRALQEINVGIFPINMLFTINLPTSKEVQLSSCKKSQLWILTM